MHVIQNLLSNALKYRSAEAPRIKIDVTEDTDYWRFSVEDNGIGISKEFHAQIFGIFKRLHDRTANTQARGSASLSARRL